MIVDNVWDKNSGNRAIVSKLGARSALLFAWVVVNFALSAGRFAQHFAHISAGGSLGLSAETKVSAVTNDGIALVPSAASSDKFHQLLTVLVAQQCWQLILQDLPRAKVTF